MCRTTNVNLNTRINSFLNHSGIQANQLDYEWNGWDEGHACKLFQWFRDDLREALDKKNMHEIQMCIERILSWGGINKNKKIVNMFKNHFSVLLLELHRRNGALDRDLIDMRLPSWTKVLAAYDPEQFCIYDSRVAIALRFLFRKDNWFIPVSQKTNAGLLASTMGRGSEPIETYLDYLDLLRNASPGNPGTYEKKLFMLGGVLTDMYANNPDQWKDATDW